MYRIELSDKDYELIQYLVWTYLRGMDTVTTTFHRIQGDGLFTLYGSMNRSDVEKAWHNFTSNSEYIPDLEVSNNEQTDTEV